MAFGTLVTIAWRDLGRNRRRTLLSLLAVALGLALLIALNGLVAGVMADAMENAIRLNTGHVQVRAPSYDETKLSLQARDLVADVDGVLARARALPAVQAAAPVLWAGAILTKGDESTDLRLVGLDPTSDVNARLRSAVVAGQFLAPDDPSGMLLGQRLADDLGVKVGDKVSLALVDGDGRLQEGAFTVRGLFATGVLTYDEGSVLMPLAKAQALAGAKGEASAVVLLLRDKRGAAQVAAALAGPGLAALTWAQLNELYVSGLQYAMNFYILLDLIVMLVVAVVIANTLLMAVFERIREMGILAALGMKGRQILQMYLLEAGLLGLVGVVIGIALGLVAVAWMAKVGIEIGDIASVAGNMTLGTTMRARFDPGSVIGLSIGTLVIILLASLYPAWYAARLEPVDALRRS
jgi:ABC-type lipoprotein release transport system permease subunit